MNLIKVFVPSFIVAVGLMSGVFLKTAEADGHGVKLGFLNCKQTSGGVNFIIHSVHKVRCTFKTANGVENYTGEAGIGLGLDLEWSKQKTIIYAVIGAVKDVQIGAHALAGKYVGGKVSASAGLGVGAQALVGAGNKGIALQPIAVEGTEGVGVAGGASYLFLKAAP